MSSPSRGPSPRQEFATSPKMKKVGNAAFITSLEQILDSPKKSPRVKKDKEKDHEKDKEVSFSPGTKSPVTKISP
jgi:hypothetical protein